MKKLTRRQIISIALAGIFIISLVGMGYKLFQYWQGDQVYGEAEDLANVPDLTQISGELSEPERSENEQSGSSVSSEEIPEEAAPVYVDPYADALQNMDFAALREVNDDVLGWIVIPNTRLSYPLLQGEDNDYYLDHTWRKYWNSVGAIFMEWQCSPDLSDFNTIIYGHRVNNRSMFGTLLKYDDLSYWEAHPRVYITDDSGSHVYDIFAAYEVELNTPTYWLFVNRKSDKQAFLDYCLEQSVIDTGIVPTTKDQIVTLSTCTGSGHNTRWVVQGVKWGAPQEEVPGVEEPPAPVTEPEVIDDQKEEIKDPDETEREEGGSESGEVEANSETVQNANQGTKPPAAVPSVPPEVVPEATPPKVEEVPAEVPEEALVAGSEGEPGQEAEEPETQPDASTPAEEKTLEQELKEKYLEGLDWDSLSPEIQKVIRRQIERELFLRQQ